MPDNSPDAANLHQPLLPYQPIYLYSTSIRRFPSLSSRIVQDIWPNGKAPAHNGLSVARHEVAELSMRIPQHGICDSSPPGGRDAGHASSSLAVSINLYFFFVDVGVVVIAER